MLVDAEDFEWLNACHWFTTDGYAARKRSRAQGGGTILMHREILGLKIGDGQCSDHRNRDRLDNRRANLRLATRAQNQQNLPAQRLTTSRFRGVCWHKGAEKWIAQVGLGYRKHYLGLFTDELGAARAAAAFRREHMPFSEEAPS